MRIIHLSDLHVDKNDFVDINKTIADLVSCLKSINSEKKIDLIIFTGDLINTGGKSFRKIGEAFLAFKMLFIDRLIKELNLGRDRILFAPGNHDVDRNADSIRIEKGLQSELFDTDSVNNFYDEKTEEGIKRILPYKKFESDYFKDIYSEGNYYISNFESCFKLHVEGLSIGIASLNSAWRCYDSKNDKGKILFGERQITKSSEFLKESELKIAISHHHYSWTSDFESKKIESLLSKHYEIFFCGHTHSNDASFSATLSGKMFTSVAPGTLSKNKLKRKTDYDNGFSVIDYDLEIKEVTFTFYNYIDLKGFSINTSIIENGIWRHPILFGKDAEEKLQKQFVLMNIKEELPSLNKHLLSFGTSSNAPKSLQEIFVMPNLIKSSAKDDEEVVVEDFAEIITANENFIIFGIKEIGKTVLLDKLLIDILNTNIPNNYIPVRLDYINIQSDISSSISKNWKKNKKETESILESENVILLIDDMSLTDLKSMQYLNTFLEKYTKVRYIGTCLQLFEDNITTISEQYEILTYTKLTLKQFKSKQIRSLISKWFPSIPVHDKPKKFGMLINAFLSLNLPRTPFAVSMFLWIIERQQAYRPQNNATLIEKFIEEILDKKSIKETYRENFDYENKIYLLSEIAFLMLSQSNINYSLTYSSLLSIVEQHLSVRKFPKTFKSNSILGELIDIGIFIEEGSAVRFRFNCFFEYFLVKKMERDTVFFEEVLKEENYINFVNEIDYFTGLNRGNKYILRTIIDRLEYSYIDVNDIVFSRVSSIDDYFNIDRSLVEAIKAKELFDLLPKKKTDEDEESINDEKLEQCENGEIILKKDNSNKFLCYGQVLLLAMRILKNSEEIDEENLKSNCYSIVLKNSISYSILFKMICENFIKHADKFSKARIDDFKFTLKFLPVIHQTFISENLGTYKLAEVINEKIELDKDDSISEFEKFLSVYLYCDIKGEKYKNIMLDFIKIINKNYIADACYIKLSSYYYSSNNSAEDLALLNLLADLYIKVNTKLNTSKRFDKGKLIQDFQNKKKGILEDNKK